MDEARGVENPDGLLVFLADANGVIVFFFHLADEREEERCDG